MVGGKAQDLKDGIGLASEAIDSGEALRRMEALVELSSSLAP
jgi:anthranilate phosphoribosyltransferase